MPDDRLKVGDVAKRTGLTVRTLHHYDEIGLLVPSHRVGSGGHRLYSAADLARLQQILSLRQLGFSLDEIADCIARPGFDPRAVIHLHLARAREVLKSQNLLCVRLASLSDALGRAEPVSVEQFLSTLEATVMAQKHFDLPPDQSAALAAHWAKFSPQDIEAVQNEWPGLIAKMTAARDAGTDPADPAVRAMAKRWMELVAMFTGGNQAVSDQLRTKYESDPSLRAKTGVDPELMEYVNKARDAGKTA